jgi:N-ethylmaleimide reductase
MNVDPLFTPLSVGRMDLAHRVVMPPLTRRRAERPGNVPGTLNAEYYRQRATPGGLLIAEATQIMPAGQGLPDTPGIHSQEQIEGWRLTTDAVHEQGGVVVLQLWHMGRLSHSSFQPDDLPPVAPSAVPRAGTTLTATGKPAPAETPRAMTIDQIDEVVAAYVTAARNALEAGFDGVEIHAAHGYLIDQFLDSSTNRRTDKYGGSDLNRVRFLAEVTTAVVEAVHAERVGVRLSPFGALEGATRGVDEGDRQATYAHAIRTLADLGPAYLHLIEPRVDPLAPHAPQAAHGQPTREAGSGARLYRPLWPGVLLTAGGLTVEQATKLVADGAADAVAFGRGFISNPDLVARIRHQTNWTPWDRPTFYTRGPVGYTDYPRVHEPAM